jgi:hypothetical protein
MAARQYQLGFDQGVQQGRSTLSREQEQLGDNLTSR